MTWAADFWSDTANITVSWKWAASVYKPGLSGDYNALGVKPVDNKDLSVYHNGDQSGTPEAYKSLVTAGATGGGGSNYTGNNANTAFYTDLNGYNTAKDTGVAYVKKTF